MERCVKTGIEHHLGFKFCLYFCLTVLKLNKVVSTFYERTAIVTLKQKPSKFKKIKILFHPCVPGLKICQVVVHVVKFGSQPSLMRTRTRVLEL